MGLFDRFIKQDSAILGFILFYTTATVITLIFNRDQVNIIDKVIVNNDIIDIAIVNNDIIDKVIVSNDIIDKVIVNNDKVVVNNDKVIEETSSTVKVTPPSPSPPPPPTTTSTKSIYYLSGFTDILKQGIPIYRIKSHKKKKKIIIMDDTTETICIRATNLLSSMKNIKEFSLENIDSIKKNEKNDNGFSMVVNDGTMVSKYELLSDSKSHCEYIFNGLLALKEHQLLERQTATLPEASTFLLLAEKE